MEGARWDLRLAFFFTRVDTLAVVGMLPDVRRNAVAKDTTEGLMVTDNDAAKTCNIEMHENTLETSHNKLETTATTTEIALATTRPTTYYH